MKLNIGAGNSPLEGYLSVDIAGGDITAPAWELPFEDYEIDAIYSRHMFEHLDYREAGRALREWYRVLRPGGECRIICPDRDKVLAQIGNYVVDPLKGKTFHQCAMHSLFGWQRDGYDYHKWAWNYTELREAMLGVGFRTTSRRDAPDLNILGVK